MPGPVPHMMYALGTGQALLSVSNGRFSPHHCITYAINAFFGPDMGSFSKWLTSTLGLGVAYGSAIQNLIHHPFYYILILGFPLSVLYNWVSRFLLHKGFLDSISGDARWVRYIKSGTESSATLECGGGRLGSKGFYVEPTVFSNVQYDMLIVKDEIFGPVQSILKFKELDEVIKRANTTHYGLAAGVFTKNINMANTLSRALRVGTVWVNCFDVFDAGIPFGGCKMSGTGREKGIYSLKNYLQVKAVVTPLKNPAWL